MRSPPTTSTHELGCLLASTLSKSPCLILCQRVNLPRFRGLFWHACRIPRTHTWVPPSPGHLQKLSPEFLQCPRPLLLALSQARAAGLQPSFHPRSNRSPPCGRGRVAASTQRSYVGRRPGPRRPRSAVRRACGLGTSLVGQELNELGVVRSQGPVTRSESLDDAGGNTAHVNKRTSRYLRVLTELFQLVTLDSNTRTYQLSPKVTAYTAPYH